jgi:hypothetical protein
MMMRQQGEQNASKNAGNKKNLKKMLRSVGGIIIKLHQESRAPPLRKKNAVTNPAETYSKSLSLNRFAVPNIENRSLPLSLAEGANWFYDFFGSFLNFFPHFFHFCLASQHNCEE